MSKQSLASHIMGGNIVFNHVNSNNYAVGIEVFVDCYRGNPAAFYEDSLVLGIFSKSTDALVQQLPLKINPGFDQELQITKDDCAAPVDFCMYVVFYSDTFTFDPLIFDDPEGYYISWERCCRNSVVLNVRDPDEIGTAFYAEIPPFAIKNSIPSFKKLPLNLLCVNTFFKYNFKIEDPDADSLKMSLVAPLKGRTTKGNDNSNQSAAYPLLEPRPYAEVIWANGFSINNVMNGDPELSIDPQTGVVTVKPTRQGDYAFAIKVEEYRKGVKIGEVIREMQYKVSTCEANKVPNADLDIKDSIIDVYPGQEVNLNWLFQDESGDSIYISAQSNLFNESIIGEPVADFLALNGNGKARASFYWKPNCDHINSELYKVTIDATDNGCPFPATNSADFYIRVLDPPVYPKPADFCVKRLQGDSIQLTWALEEYGTYFGGIIIEQKLEGGAWQKVDSVGKKRIKEYRTSIADNDIVNVCFRIRAVNICGVRGEVSDSFCSVLHVDKPPLRSELINVTVNEREHVELTWEPNFDFDFNSYQIFRAINGEIFDYYAKVTDPLQTSFTDSIINADSNYYEYYIETVDDCNDRSPISTKGASILLKGKIQPFDNEVWWTDFFLWKPESFTITGVGKPSGLTFGQQFDNLTFGYTHELDEGNDGVWQYRLYAENKELGITSYSNTLDLVQKPVVLIPTAFSPNDDNLNEDWTITADFVGEYFLQVFNRWGQLVFETQDPNKFWDGKNALDGVYLYKLTYRDLTGRISFTTGTVQITK
ncbi:MAG: gliding motility-associated C-terminal domain-containing protein [Bacteroidia bacterium]